MSEGTFSDVAAPTGKENGSMTSIEVEQCSYVSKCIYKHNVILIFLSLSALPVACVSDTLVAN